MIDLGNVFLVIIIHVVAQAAHIIADTLLRAEIGHHTAVDDNADIGKRILPKGFLDSGAHGFGVKGAMLLGIDGDHDIQDVKQTCGLAHDGMMAVGIGVERACVQSSACLLYTSRCV